MNKPYITLLLLGFVFSCQFQSQKQGHFPIQQDPSLRLFRNGKLKNAPILSEKFSPYSLDSVDCVAAPRAKNFHNLRVLALAHRGEENQDGSNEAP